MQLDHHDLHTDFPQLGPRIHQLKTEDPHFAKMFEEYDALDHEIRRIEEHGSAIGDVELEKMKYRRIHLKDALYAALTKPS
ncbi:MAG: GTP-binding protein [Fibrobacteres bacterium]|nr:GTP-binding protein [Fibrobacterota bacterium]